MNIIEKNTDIEIWSLGRGWFQLFTKNLEKLTKIKRWEKVIENGIYYFPDGSIGKSFIFPSSIYDRVVNELGLPKKKKSSGRVKWGRTLQKSYSIDQVKSSISASEAV